jgi:hypothetical protein
MLFIIKTIFKTKTLKFKLKIKWTTFCGIHTKIHLIVDGKVPQRGSS